MASAQGVCMIGGDGETSHAKNSAFQSGVQSRLKPLVEEAISDLCGAAMARFLRVLDEWLLVRHFRVDGIGDAYARVAEERYMGPAVEDMKGVVLLDSLRRRK